MKDNELKIFLQSMTERGWYVDLKGPIATRFGYLFSIKNEIISINDQVELLGAVEAKDRPYVAVVPTNDLISIRQALWYSILVRYFKLFANASATPGFPTLSPQDHLQGCSTEQLNFHNYLKEIRDQHLSHGIHFDSQQMIVRAYYEIDPEDGGLGYKPGVVGIKRFSCSIEELEKLKELLQMLLKNLQPKLTKANEALNVEIESIHFSTEELSRLKQLYEITLELRYFKEAWLEYILLNHFGLTLNNTIEERISRIQGETVNHEFIWLDYETEHRQLILEFQFLPSGYGKSTTPIIRTRSPIVVVCMCPSLVCKIWSQFRK
jgi:hypothetical protein